MGYQMPTDTSKAKLSMKYLLLDGVSSLGQESRQKAQMHKHSAIFILDFPFAFLLQVY